MIIFNYKYESLSKDFMENQHSRPLLWSWWVLPPRLAVSVCWFNHNRHLLNPQFAPLLWIEQSSYTLTAWPHTLCVKWSLIYFSFFPSRSESHLSFILSIWKTEYIIKKIKNNPTTQKKQFIINSISILFIIYFISFLSQNQKITMIF